MPPFLMLLKENILYFSLRYDGFLEHSALCDWIRGESAFIFLETFGFFCYFFFNYCFTETLILCPWQRPASGLPPFSIQCHLWGSHQQPWDSVPDRPASSVWVCGGSDSCQSGKKIQQDLTLKQQFPRLFSMDIWALTLHWFLETGRE